MAHEEGKEHEPLRIPLKLPFPPATPGQVTPNTAGTAPFAVGNRQWIRAVKVILTSATGASVDMSNMRVQFMVRQADQQQPNWCYIRVTNLSEATANAWLAAARAGNLGLTLEAGYVSRIGPIFKGQVIQVRKGKEPNGVDKYFDIMATSLEKAYGYSHINKTLEAGHTYKDIVDECTKILKQNGLDIGFIADLGTRKFPRASTLFGNVKDILRHVAFSTNTSWSVQNNKFQMVKVDGYLPGDIKVLNSQTGMIGQPEQTIKGIVVKCLIDSGVTPGGRVHINEASITRAEISPEFGGPELHAATMPTIAADGIYKIVRVDHDGDMEGTPWYTTITCIAGDSTIGEGAAIVAAGFAGSDVRGVTEQEPGEGGGAAP